MLETKNRMPSIDDDTLETNKPTALIADDDLVIRALLRHTLEKAGFDLIEAENGLEALERLTSDVSVILLDLNMPEMDGITCLKKIITTYDDVSPIMVTASDDVSDAVKCMKIGALDYIVKPVDPDQLIAVAQKAHESWQQKIRLKQLEKDVKEAREREIRIASKMQNTLLMGQPPKLINGMEIAQLTIPSHQVDGDFFDFLKLNNESLDIVVGDVMGKGMASALLGAAIKNQFLRVINELILTDPTRPPAPSDIISRLYLTTIDHMQDIDAFVSVCYARIDLSKSEFIFVDCGHMRTIHYQAKMQTVSLLQGVNMPLGFPEIDDFEQIAVPFSPGDFFLFYSDALTETKDPSGEMFGEDQLARFVERNGHETPDDLIAAIRDKLFDHAQSDRIEDDFTCVVAKIYPTYAA